MIVWLDNHLSPALARWIADEFSCECVVVRDVGLARATDREIFDRVRAASGILVTKDRDFAELVDRLGAPPSVILLSCGNTSTAFLRVFLQDRLRTAFALIEQGEALVEIGGEV
ncbi:MAG: DUF5615 family PIN-like protein [Hyphomonadaceae bacterium]|nr:DUF5615 family PIN-like protein [Hyphomonadaceae bacterium]